MTGRTEASLDLGPTPRSVPAARRLARRLAERAGLTPDTAEAVELVVSELVTNAVIHTGTPSRLHLVVARGVVRIEVCDEAPLPPMLRLTSATATTGRGLRLLNALTESWGVEEVDGGGKMVWAEVAVEARPDEVLAARYADVASLLRGPDPAGDAW